MRPSVRLAALMELPVTFVWTHDSIGLGEDGPTHQPIEHLWSLRNIPHLEVVRPGDANETVVAWRTILERARPAALCLTRQNLPVLDRSGELEGAAEGGPGRVRAGPGDGRHPDRHRQRGPDRAGGPRAAGRRRRLGPGRVHAVRRVVRPSRTSPTGAKSCRPRSGPGSRWKPGITPPWKLFAGDAGASIGVDHYGASAAYQKIYEEFGITAERVAAAARDSLARV